jgi:hypothetical protein
MKNRDGLDPRELAKIKLAARRKRVSAVRRKVAIFGLSITAAFSGLVLALNGVPLVLGSQQSGSTGVEVVKTDGAEQNVGATLVAFASGLVLDEDEEEQEGGGFFSTNSTPTQSAQS